MICLYISCNLLIIYLSCHKIKQQCHYQLERDFSSARDFRSGLVNLIEASVSIFINVFHAFAIICVMMFFIF